VNGPIEWVAVTATVDVGGITHTAVQNVHADQYDGDGGLSRAHARVLARCALEDTIREAHPHMSVRDAFDTANYKSTITTSRYIAAAEQEPF
jgi:hypothetical protein